MERGDDAARVVHAVEEVGVAERHVARPAVDLRGDVGEHGVDVGDADATVVDDRAPGSAGTGARSRRDASVAATG